MTIIVPEWFMWLLFGILVLHAGQQIGEMYVAHLRRRLEKRYRDAVMKNSRITSMTPQSVFIAGMRENGELDAYRMVAREGDKITLEPMQFPPESA